MNDPELEFDFYLAHELSKTVGEIREMPHEEYVHWVAFFGRKSQGQLGKR